MVYSVVEDPMASFLYALKSPISKKKYPQRLRVFLRFLGFNGVFKDDALVFLKKAREDPEWVEDKLMQFISSQIERLNRGEMSAATISNYYKAVKLFCEMNRITLSWKILRHGVPTGNRAADDRAPNLEEYQRHVEYPDPRIKPIASSGIRLGAWDFLRWKHISSEMDRSGGSSQDAGLCRPKGKKKQYISRISAEAYNALVEWMDYRKKHGEQITGESWIMRDLWQTTNVRYDAKLGLATYPKQLKLNGIKSLKSGPMAARNSCFNCKTPSV
jgi:hypothetical protein